MQFLIYLQDGLTVEGRYSDPDLRLQVYPSEINVAMLSQVDSILKKIKWNRTDIQNFLGIYLSEPKPHVFFEQPTNPLSSDLFLRQIMKNGVQLNLKSRMLSGVNKLFMNGEIFEVGDDAYHVLIKLANDQEILPPLSMDEETEEVLYQWYVNGYVEVIKD